MKMIKTLFVAALAAFSVFGATSASAAAAPDQVSGFSREADCLSAVKAGNARQYTPVTNRAPGSSYSRMTMREAGYQNGACVQGFTTFVPGVWVYLGPDFEVGRQGETLVMWQCGNAITRISALAINQVVTQQPSMTTFTGAGSARCEGPEQCAQVRWCDDNNGWKMEGSERVCRVPGQTSRIVRENVLNIDDHLTVNPRVLPTTVSPVQGNGDFTVNFPGPQGVINYGQSNIQIQRQQNPVVSGTVCNGSCPVQPPIRPQAATGSCGPIPCRPTQVGRLTEMQASPDGVCRIAATTNDKEITHFVALQSYGNGDLAVFQQRWNGSEYVQVGNKMRFQGVRMTDCREIIRTVAEGRSGAGVPIWHIVRQGLGLPNTCEITGRTGQIARAPVVTWH